MRRLSVLAGLWLALISACVLAEDSIVMYVQLPFPDGYRYQCTQNSNDTPTHNADSTRYDLDFGVPVGKIVVAAADGTFYHEDNPNGFGRYGRVDHGNGYWTIYGHLDGFIAQDGQEVVAGQPIAYSGNTGNSTGAHLHFGVHSGDGVGVSERMNVYAYNATAKHFGDFATGLQTDARREFVCGLGNSGHIYESRPIGSTFGDYTCRSLTGSNGILCWTGNPTTCEDGDNHVRYYHTSQGYQSESGNWSWCYNDDGDGGQANVFAFLEGNYGIGGPGNGNPTQTNLTIDFDILDVDGNELYAGKDTLGPMTVKLRVQVTAQHDDAGNWAKAGREKISIDYFSRTDGTDWTKVGKGEMTIGKLDEGQMIQETLIYGIPNQSTTRVEFKASIDTDHEIDESDEGDNTSRIESFAYDVNAPAYSSPDMTMAGLSLTGGRTQLTQGDRFGLNAWPKNVGGRKAAASRMAYYLQSPGGGLNYVMDDGVDELNPGQDSYELTRNEPFTANVGGWWRAYAFADYQGNVTESNEGNNGLDYWFYVVPAMPDLIVEALWLREGGSVKKDTRVHPYCVVKNIGNGTAGPSRLAYYIDQYKYRDGDDVDSLCPGCNATEHVINDNIRLGDTGNRTYRCCVDALGAVGESNESNNCATIGFTVRKK